MVWNGIIDYERVEWSQIQSHKKIHSEKMEGEMASFRNRRIRSRVFATMVNDSPVWFTKGQLGEFVFDVH